MPSAEPIGLRLSWPVGSVLPVAAGTKLAILDRNSFSWSVAHPRHPGVALKIRVIDVENTGKTGFVLAAWLDFTDQSGRIDLDKTPVVKILREAPAELSRADSERIILAAREAVLRVHPGVSFGTDFVSVDSAGRGAYEIQLSVAASKEYAKCEVHKVGASWIGDVIYFPRSQ